VILITKWLKYLWKILKTTTTEQTVSFLNIYARINCLELIHTLNRNLKFYKESFNTKIFNCSTSDSWAWIRIFYLFQINWLKWIKQNYYMLYIHFLRLNTHYLSFFFLFRLMMLQKSIKGHFYLSFSLPSCYR